jgi:hypothetical protein
LRQFYSRNPGKFLELLYRIDVDEKLVREAQSRGTGEGFVRELCDIILERELIKVIYRKLFKHLNG